MKTPCGCNMPALCPGTSLPAADTICLVQDRYDSDTICLLQDLYKLLTQPAFCRITTITAWGLWCLCCVLLATWSAPLLRPLRMCWCWGLSTTLTCPSFWIRWVALLGRGSRQCINVFTSLVDKHVPWFLFLHMHDVQMSHTRHSLARQCCLSGQEGTI